MWTTIMTSGLRRPVQAATKVNVEWAHYGMSMPGIVRRQILREKYPCINPQRIFQTEFDSAISGPRSGTVDQRCGVHVSPHV